MKISIITVCLNCKKTIEQTIRSVIEQDYEEIEYIIVDGKSTDGTLQIIEKYKDKIANVVSEPDYGIYDAMNKGIRLATGDVIAFLNSGDWYERTCLNKIGNYFQQTEADIVIGSSKNLENGECVGVQYSLPKKIEVGMCCCHQAIFVKRELFHTIGYFNTDYKISADYEWLLKAHYAKKIIMWVKDIFVNYDVEGLSAKLEGIRLKEEREIAVKYANIYENKNVIKKINEIHDQAEERMSAYNKCIEVCLNNPQYVRDILGINSCYIWGIGSDGKRCYKLLKCVGIQIEGFIDSNRMLDTLYGYAVFYPEKIEKDSTVCIASFRYENEIYEQAQEKHISDVLLYSDILNELQNLA